jgi:hypothetical protein
MTTRDQFMAVAAGYGLTPEQADAEYRELLQALSRAEAGREEYITLATQDGVTREHAAAEWEAEAVAEAREEARAGIRDMSDYFLPDTGPEAGS